ncbi:MAG: hypothetical protein ACE5EI_01265 [Thermodesulfobacteriota bacterium]
MSFSADIYELAVLIIAFAFLAFVIALIPTLLQIKRTARSVEELTTEGRKTVEVVGKLAKRTEEQAEDFEDLFKRFRELGRKAMGLADMVLDNVKSPLITILSLLLGVEFGLRQLLKLKKKQKGGSTNE